MKFIIHIETRGFLASPPSGQGRCVLGIARVDEEAADGTWARVHVFVMAPGGEVDVPVVELKLDVASAVGEVPAYDYAPGLGVGSYSLDIKELTGIKLNARKQENCGR